MTPALIGFYVSSFCHDEYHTAPGFVMEDGTAKTMHEGKVITVIGPEVLHLRTHSDCRADFMKAVDAAALEFGKDFDTVLKSCEDLQKVRDAIENERAS